jgi:prephenate dehydratase
MASNGLLVFVKVRINLTSLLSRFVSSRLVSLCIAVEILKSLDHKNIIKAYVNTVVVYVCVEGGLNTGCAHETAPDFDR